MGGEGIRGVGNTLAGFRVQRGCDRIEIALPGQRPSSIMGSLGKLGQGNPPVRVPGVDHKTVFKDEHGFWSLQNIHGLCDQHIRQPGGCVFDGIARYVSLAACRSRSRVRGPLGVGNDEGDLRGLHPEHFRSDLGEHGGRTLPDVRCAGNRVILPCGSISTLALEGFCTPVLPIPYHMDPMPTPLRRGSGIVSAFQ